MRIFLLLVFCLFAVFPHYDTAAQEESVLTDSNGDGSISILAFGDSITYGVGDERATNFSDGVPYPSRPAGYPERLQALTGTLVRNAGSPGEELVAAGIFRYPDVIGGAKADVCLILEGANDAIKIVPRGTYARGLQRLINITRVSGVTPVVASLPSPCCDHGTLSPFTDSYSSVASELSAVNGIRLVDFARAWRTTCTNPGECELYNLPEGLHPNATGYDVMAQTAAAALLGIDLFTPGGAALLESALGLEPGVVLVKPGL